MNLTIHHLLFTIRLPFTIHRKRLTDKVWKMENGKWLTAFLSIIILCSTQLVNAASDTSKTPSGITISPAFQQVSLTDLTPSRSIEFKITNNTKTSQTINLSTADFNTLGDSGGLVFVGTNPSELQKKYGLATWLNLHDSSVTIPSKQTKTISASILNESSMSPGGHYGALMLEIAESKNNSSDKNKVALHPVASSLLFVTKVGGDTHRLKLADVDLSHSVFSLPQSVTLRFQNYGNSHVTPRGLVTIADSKGKVVSRGIINENSTLMLPESYRKYTVPLTKVASANRVGNYTVKVDFRFDGYDQFRSFQAKIFILTPSAIIIPLVAILAVTICIFLLLKKPKVIKQFNKHLTFLKKRT